MRKKFTFLFTLGWLMMIGAQDLSFFETFTDHAILQRDTEHPIWGWTQPKTEVTLSLDGQVYTAKADAKGRWEVSLPPQVAGGPHQIVLTNEVARLTLKDIYFGDVFLLSGQSNMEWKLRQSDPGGQRAQEISNTMIREVTIKKSTADRPDNHLELSSAWRPGSLDNIGDFSAVGSFFAHYLREKVDVPIGLIHSSWGGSRIEPWMPAHLLGLEEKAPKQDLSSLEKAGLATYKRDFGKGRPPTEDQGEQLGYLDPETNYKKWPTVRVPGLWEANGYPSINGHFYYVRYFELSAEQAAAGATLSLGAIDDSDWTYINGQEVGAMYSAYAAERMYQVPASALKAGQNILLVRVEDTGGGGGFHSSPQKLYLETVGDKIELAGDFHYQIGSWSVDQQLNQVPTILYNKMIHPLAGMPLKSILWYQGESNAAPNDALAYADQFKAMITYWRQHFNDPELPFLWVQLANFQKPQESPDEEGWGLIRASQTAALELPFTGQAVTIDIGEADDIHPRNKWEVGRRLSLLARRYAYGEDLMSVVALSPRVIRARRLGRDGIRLSVQQDGRGLIAKSNRYPYPTGFVVQDENDQWHWAIAELLGGGRTIVVTAPKGIKAKAVRYAYANNPTDANVYNEVGLPLTPFSIKVEE